MAFKVADLIKKVKSSASNYFDADKSMSGIQLVPGGISGGVQRVKQAIQRPQTLAITPSRLQNVAQIAGKAYFNEPQRAAIKFNTRNVMSKKLSPINQQRADVVLGSLGGFEQGLAGYTGAGDALRQRLRFTPRYQPQTQAGKVGEFASGLAGYAIGPGRVFAPVEAGVQAGTAAALIKRGAPKLLANALGGIGAEATTASVLSPITAAINKTDVRKQFGMDLAGGVLGRTVGNVAQGLSKLAKGSNQVKLNVGAKSTQPRDIKGKWLAKAEQAVKKNIKFVQDPKNPNRLLRSDMPREQAVSRLNRIKFTVDPSNPNRLLRPETTQAMQGAVFGIEPEYDENGRPTGKFKYNATKGLTGAALFGGMNAVKSTPLTLEAKKYKSAEEFVNRNTLTTNGIKHLDLDSYSNKSQFLKDVDKLNYKGGDDLRDILEKAEKIWDSKRSGWGEDVVQKIDPNKVRVVEEALYPENRATSYRKIEKPIQVLYKDGNYSLVDGRHRLDQAIFNKESIEARVSGEITPLSQLTDIYNQATAQSSNSNEPIKKLDNLLNDPSRLLQKGFSLDDVKKIGVKEARNILENNITPDQYKINPSTRNTSDFSTPKQILENKPNKPISAYTQEVQDSIALANDVLRQKASILDYYRTPEKVLQKIGLGDQAVTLRRSFDAYQQELPKQLESINEWYNRVGKSPEASTRIFKWLDGQKIALSGEELNVASEIKTYLSGWADRLNLPKDSRVSNYITHLFDEELVKKEFDPELEKLIADTIPGSVYDPFLQKRGNAVGYKEDAFLALDAYVKRATRKVHMDPALEQLKQASVSLPKLSVDYIKNYTDRINMRPTDIDSSIDVAIKQSPIGYKFGQRPLATISKNLRNMVYRGTLGLNFSSAMRNLTQGANTYAELGEKWTAKGYFDVAKELFAGGKELDEVGVTSGSLVQDRTRSALKKSWERLDNTLFSVFELAEKINRGSAYFGAKARALSQGKPLNEAIQEGLDIARKTQFTFGSIDTPVALQSDIMKSLTQFQSFNLKQAEFLLDKVQKKDVAGLLRYVAAWAVFIKAGRDVLGFEWGSAVPFNNIFDGQAPIAQTPPFQLAAASVRAGVQGKDKYGNQLEGGTLQRIAGDDEVQKAVGAMTIPAFTQIKKTVEGIQAYNRGYSQTPAGNVRYPIEQTPANQIKTGIFGQYAVPQAREYFDQKKKPLSESQTNIFNSLTGQDQKSFMDAVETERELNKIIKDLEDEKIDEAQADSLIQKVSAAGDVQTVRSKNTQLQDKLNSLTKKKIKLGLTVGEQELTEAYLGDALNAKATNRYELGGKNKKLYAKSNSILTDENLTDEQKIVLFNAAAKSIGISPEDLAYYGVANDDSDLKTLYVYDQITQFQDHKQVIDFLTVSRRKVNEKLLASDTVLDNLAEDGVITPAEAKKLKAIDYDSKGKLKVKKAKKIKVGKTEQVKSPTIKFKKIATPVIKIQTKKLNLPKVKLPRVKVVKSKTKKLTQLRKQLQNA